MMAQTGNQLDSSFEEKLSRARGFLGFSGEMYE
jgi:hypothetical protein